jgi:hypothetical protein
MRRLLLLLPFILAAPLVARGDEATDLRDRVIKAHAKDPEDFKKLRTYTLKAKGVSKINPDPQPATHEIVAVWPGKMRATWEFGTGPAKNSLTLCFSDDRGWKRLTGAGTFDFTVEELNDFRADAYAFWVATLATLSDPETTLAMTPKAKVGADVVVGLRLARRPWPEITLYFDEKTLLLRKMAYQSRDAGVIMAKEMTYDGHKEFKGVKLPTKQTTVVKGRLIYEWTEMDYTFPDRVDPKTFEKP